MGNFKTGKAKKKNNNITCNSYNNAVIQGDKNGQYYSLGGMLEYGYIHKGGKDKTGRETFIEGTHFMEEARDDFEDDFYNDCEDFIEDMLDNHGLS